MNDHARITTPFGADSTAAEVIEGIDLSGKRAIVTGAASGIGVETAGALAGAGAEVTLAVRKADAGEKVAAEIRETTGNDAVSVGMLDLADLASVREFVSGWEGALDLLINNAGVMAISELELNGAGWEMQFATNHLGHFALTYGLHEALVAAGTARVVSVSSSGHLNSPVIFDDVNFDFRRYDPWAAYGQSKTANVLLAVEVTKRWADEGITSNALMPGGIETNLQRHLPPDYIEKAKERMGSAFQMKSTEQGAATSVLLASSPLLDGIGGRYFEDCNEAELLEKRNPDKSAGVAPFALDAANAERLWELSLEAIKP
jgi:NAD(P)-dependent dehydrogenase (short-subunit alcohol dehydrogenase family)